MAGDLFEIEGPSPAERAPEDDGRREAGAPELVDILINVWTVPGPGRTSWSGRQAGALRVRSAAPPGSQRESRAVLDLVAGTLGLDTAQVEMAEGAAGRRLKVRARGVVAEEARRRIESALAETGHPEGPRRAGSGARPWGRS